MPDIMIATRTGDLRVEGHLYRLRRGRTTAHSTHPAVTAAPHLWTPLQVDLPAPDADEVEVTTMADADPVTIPAAQSPNPAGELDTAEWRATVREWAAGQGIDVSPRGKIPAAVVDQYRSAHRDG